MKKFDLPLVLDVFFYAACAFLLALGILRYFGAPLSLSTLSALSVALSVGTVLFLLIRKKHRKIALGKEARVRRDKLLLHLALERGDRLNAQLKRAFEADGQTAEENGDGLTVGETLCLPRFTMQPLSADEAARVLREHGENSFALLVNDVTAEAEKLLCSFGKKIVRGDEIFLLFERTGTTPDPLICGELPRPKLRAKLQRTFKKQNARPFFVSGALLLVMSLFTLFPVYYLVAGSLLVFVSICVRLLGYA